MNEYDKLKKLLIRKLISLIEANKSESEIKKELRKLALRHKSKIDLFALLSIDISEELFKAEYLSMEQNAKVKLNKLVTETIPEQLVSTVRRYRRIGADARELQNAVKRTMNIADRHVRTLTNTVDGAVSQAISNKNAIKAGVKKFRYTGRKYNARPFCAERVGKVFTLDQIKTMDNGQGLDVMFYCGGYNCTHRWVAVAD